MSEMVERVAMAIFETNQREIGGAITPWEEATESAHRISRAMARAAIEAMREPTEAMIDCMASSRLSGGPMIPQFADAQAWKAAITAALK